VKGLQWLLFTLVFVCAVATMAWGDGYFNSAELGCSGSDSNVLFCDDFEHKANGTTPGNWYGVNADVANASGGVLTQSKGWAGTIYADPITPAGAVDCSPGITPFGSCAATSGVLSGGVGGRNMADHGFAGGVEVQELYVRWYYKPSATMRWAGQKVLDGNRACGPGGGCGGIFWWGFGYNIGAGDPASTSAGIAFAIGTQNPVGSKICSPGSGNPEVCYPNQGASIDGPVRGHWNFYELHIRLNTPGSTNGLVEMWLNDCGVNGTTCGGAPILIMRHTSVDFGKTSGNGGMGTLWFENWSNSGDSDPVTPGNQCGGFEPSCGSVGQEWYDQIKVSRVGPIGFSGTGVPGPTAPCCLTLTPADMGVSGALTLVLFVLLRLRRKKAVTRA